MNVKNTIVDKFMKTTQDDEEPTQSTSYPEQKTDTGNIPDEFTNKLVIDTEQTFPSINRIQEDEEEDQKHFVYLDEDDLSRDFLMDRDLTKQYTLQLVMYHMNISLETPFLEFYLEKSDEMYCFPERVLDNKQLEENIDAIHQTQQGGMDIQTEQHGEIEIGTQTTIREYDDVNPFEQQVFELFHNKTGYSDIIAENAYKGFVEYNDVVYVLFENKDKVLSNEENKHVWSVLDEILMNKSVLRTPIHESVYQLFSENMRLAHITSNGQVVDIPLVIYPVDKVNTIYENIYYNREEAQETYLITMPQETEELGHVYRFTCEILPSNQEIEHIKRMVTFSKDALYMLIKPTKDIFEKYPIVRFKEDELTFWGISNYLLFTELL